MLTVYGDVNIKLIYSEKDISIVICVIVTYVTVVYVYNKLVNKVINIILGGSLALLLHYVLQLKFLAFLFRYKTWFEKSFFKTLQSSNV